MMQHVILSGCSGGGKSTLLNELAFRGFETVLNREEELSPSNVTEMDRRSLGEYGSIR